MEMALPRVTGRHRNKALAAARRASCVTMALEGRTYQHIADRLGYANRGTVYRLVQQALRERQAESIDDLRTLELSRLDAIQAAHWRAALDGDLAAASLVMKVIDRRARILGLLGPTTSDAVPEQESQGLVVHVDPAELVACGGLPAQVRP